MEKEVNLYITPTSPDTDKIKGYLEGEGIEFRVYDIHSDVDAHKRMLEAARGACTAPVVEIGHQIVCGFDSKRLKEAIAYELH